MLSSDVPLPGTQHPTPVNAVHVCNSHLGHLAHVTLLLTDHALPRLKNPPCKSCLPELQCHHVLPPCALHCPRTHLPAAPDLADCPMLHFCPQGSSTAHGPRPRMPCPKALPEDAPPPLPSKLAASYKGTTYSALLPQESALLDLRVRDVAAPCMEAVRTTGAAHCFDGKSGDLPHVQFLVHSTFPPLQRISLQVRLSGHQMHKLGSRLPAGQRPELGASTADSGGQAPLALCYTVVPVSMQQGLGRILACCSARVPGCHNTRHYIQPGI